MWEVARSLDAYASFEGSSMEESSEDSSSKSELFKEKIEIPLAVAILILYVVLGHSLELWTTSHKADPSSRKGFLCTFHESGPAILLGLAVGLMVNYGVGEQFDFDAETFFYVVLPPIIFHQGYALKKKNFFKYFHYIFSFGFLGTVIQFVTITILAYYVSNSKYVSISKDDGVVIGLSMYECMLMAAVFSAADEVATLSLIKQSEYPKLSAVLFGEGVLNDALSILLFQTVRSGEGNSGSGETSMANMGAGWLLFQAMYNLISAAAVGLGSGLMISYLMKSLDSIKESPVRHVAILMLGGYLSFSLSEAFELSGILSVFFCGLTLSHYAWHSLGQEAQTASKITSETLSMIAEAYCFASIGLSVHEFDAGQWCWGFIVAMIFVLMIARSLSVYGICIGGSLCFPASFSMPSAEQHVLFFGGLVRGAIAWAQVVQVKDPHRSVMVTTSLGVILFTTVFFGAVMPFFTRGLKPEARSWPPAGSTLPSMDKSIFQYHLPGDALSSAYQNSYSYDHQMMTSMDDSMSMFSAASSVINPSSVRGVVHRVWNAFDNRYMKGLFGGEPHDNSLLDQTYPNYGPALSVSQTGNYGIPGGTGGLSASGAGALHGTDSVRGTGGAAHLFSTQSSSFGSAGDGREDAKGGESSVLGPRATSSGVLAGNAAGGSGRPPIVPASSSAPPSTNTLEAAEYPGESGSGAAAPPNSNSGP